MFVQQIITYLLQLICFILLNFYSQTLSSNNNNNKFVTNLLATIIHRLQTFFPLNINKQFSPQTMTTTQSQFQQQPLLFDPKQQNLPYTIAIMKPDTVLEPTKLNEILAFIEDSKLLSIKNMFQRELGKQQVKNLFYKHENKDYFEDLCQYMRSGQCCVMVLVNADGTQGDPVLKWKDMIGPSNPDDAKKSKPSSFRAKYGTTLIKNEFHGSDNIIQANKERKIFNFKVPQKAPQFVDDPFKVTFRSIQQFLQPPNLQHSCINERMDILALYGPIVNWHSIQQCFCVKCKPIARQYSQKIKSGTKQKILKNLKQSQIRTIFQDLCPKCQQHCQNYSHLAGGRLMQHLLTDNEIKELVYEINKKELIEMLTIQKGSTAKVMIEKIQIKEPKQVQYNLDFFKLLLQQIDTDFYDRYDFTELQNLILQDRRIRISYWVSKIVSKSIDRFPAVTSLDNTLTPQQLKDPKSPFFTLTRKLPLPLLIKQEQIKNVPLLFPPSIMDKPKLYRMEENLVIEKTLNRNLTKVISVGQKTKNGIREAVTLLRPYNEGRHGDWDNYSLLHGNNKKGPVGGPNMSTYVGN